MEAKGHRPQTSLLKSEATRFVCQDTNKPPADDMDAFSTPMEMAADNVPKLTSEQEHNGDPWFQKHGVKGFLDWNLLWEDVPNDKFCLGPKFPGHVLRSPRSEARSLAKVQSQSARWKALANLLQIRELLDNPPKHADPLARPEIRPNDRVSIFGPSPASRSKFNTLAQDKQLVAKVWNSASVGIQKSEIGAGVSTRHSQSDPSEGAGEKPVMKDTVEDTSFGPNEAEGSKSKSKTVEAEEVKEPFPLGSDFVTPKERMPLEIKKPGRDDQLSSAAIPRQVAQPSDTAHHRRQSSSLRATAPIFQSQGLLNLPTTTSNQQPSSSDQDLSRAYIPPHRRALSSAQVISHSPVVTPQRTAIPARRTMSTSITTRAPPHSSSTSNPWNLTFQPMGSFTAPSLTGMTRPPRLPHLRAPSSSARGGRGSGRGKGRGTGAGRGSVNGS